MMLTNLYKTTYDSNFVKIIKALLSNFRYFVTLDGKLSRCRNSQNGLSQGSVLAPALFIIYTNNQRISNDKNVKHFISSNMERLKVPTFQSGTM